MAKFDFGPRMKKAWDAFFNNRDPTQYTKTEVGTHVSYYRPDLPAISVRNQKSIANAVYTRISVDCAQVKLIHARLDDLDRYAETIHDSLNECLNFEANVDQTGRAFIQNAVHIMLDAGHVAIVPTRTSRNPNKYDSFEIYELRCGTVVEWRPNVVKVKIFNEERGIDQEIYMAKKAVAVIQNPFYSVMNAPNSTLTRLSRKMALLDSMDEEHASGKLNMIVQVPYSLKTELKEKQADARLKSIEKQLAMSPLGIAYIDQTEKVITLNRPLDNNLHEEVKDLTAQFYAQLGITENIMNGTAQESENLAYTTRIIEPIMSGFADEMRRKFISKTARSDYWHESIVYFREQFKLVPAAELAKIADAFTRNAIVTSNEFRQYIGLPPANDPNADILANKNMPYADQMLPGEEGMDPSMMDPSMMPPEGMEQEQPMDEYYQEE